MSGLALSGREGTIERSSALDDAEEFGERQSRIEVRRFERENDDANAAAVAPAAARAYVPALDGLRALAVCAVVVYHLPVSLLEGGLLGVSVFFTLSGYLITSLLLEEARQHGTISLTAFWVRRARRLLPALLLMLTVVGCATAVAEPEKLSAIARQVVGALFYVSNWVTVGSGEDYFRRVAGPGALDHLWSLAVEEQFYIVWPLLVAATLRLGARWSRRKERQPLLLLTVTLTAASTACIWCLYDPGAANNTRAYEGTDARAAAILAGALAALLVPMERGSQVHGQRARVAGPLGLLGLLGVALLITYVEEQSSFLYRGGELLLSVCSALVAIAAVHRHTWVARVLGIAPLRWLGARSYGLYLWHLPVIAFMSPAPLLHPTLHVAAMVLTVLVLAALSHRLFEEPIRRRLGATPLALALRALVLVPLAVVALALVPRLFAPSLGPAALAAERQAEMALRSQPAADDAELIPSLAALGVPSGAAQTGEVERALTSCRELIHIGDSTSVGLIAKGVLPNAEERITARYHAVGVEHFIPEISGARSMVETFEGQPNATQVAKKHRRGNFKGCWVLALGTNDPANTGGNVEMLRARIDAMMAVVGGDPVIWTTTKTRLDKGPYRNANMEKWNQTIGEACARYPRMRVYDWASEVKDDWFNKDGIHFNNTGCKERAARFARAIAAAFPKDGASPSTCMVHAASE